MKFIVLNLPRSALLHFPIVTSSIFSIALLSALLSACGGEGGVGSGGTGITAAGLQTGTVSGFGSVIIEGNKYDDSAAIISVETEPGNPVTASGTQIKLGMQVRAQFDATEKLSSVVAVPTVVGLVSEVNLNSLIVAGQTIRVLSSTAGASAPTIFDGIASSADLIKGDRVEIFGQLDANNAVVATRIELLDDANVLTKITGVASAVTSTTVLNTTAQRFSVGALTVSVDSSTKRLPLSITSSLIKNGDIVTVWSNADASTTLLAKAVRIEDGAFISSTPWRVGGPISQLDAVARTLRIGDVVVNFASATFSSGLSADLQNGLLVRVKGTAASANNRQLNAADIQLIKASDKVKIELSGTISDYSNAGSFRVRGTLINASATSIIFENGSAGNFGDGVLLDLEGEIVNGVMAPSRIRFKTTEDSRTRSFIGNVASYNNNSSTFSLLGTSAKLNNSTIYKTLLGANATVASFSNGANVQVTGSFTQGVFLVDEVRYQGIVGSGGGNTAPRQVKIDGVASMINFGTRTLTLNGNTVSWTPSTSINDIARLKNGALIQVEGVGSGLTISASKIDIKQR
jgi:Domain of unknown function (DUF5666)